MFNWSKSLPRDFRVCVLSAGLIGVSTLFMACSSPASDEPIVIDTDNHNNVVNHTTNNGEVPNEQALCAEVVCSEDMECDGMTGLCKTDLADKCTDGTKWSSGTQAFENSDDKTEFELAGIVGGRISSADIDGDGFSDLIVRRGGLREDDFSDSEEALRSFWLLRNNGDGSFDDITQSSGILQRRYATNPELGRPAEVVAFADINNNGLLDVVTLFSNADASNLHPEGSEILFNQGDGTFELGPISEGFHKAAAQTSHTGVAFADVNRDGFIDMWLGTGGPDQDRLFLGDGSGQFEEITSQAGLTTSAWMSVGPINEARAHSNSWSVAACDLDGNGVPELLSASYGRAPNHLWLGRLSDGEISYDNHSIASGYAFDHRTDWSDHESARCYCKLNPEAPDCEGVPDPQYIRCTTASDVFRWNHTNDREPFRLGGNSGTTVCADINNNGKMDLLTTEIVHWDVGSTSDPSEILYQSDDSPLSFERPGNEVTGLERPAQTVPWDNGDITAAVFDFDNDGRQDILIASTDYPGTRAWLFHQKDDGKFERVPVAEGIDLTSAHGIAVADFNNDGALDVVIGHSRNRCSSGDHCQDSPHVRYFENTIGQNGNWIKLTLQGGEMTNRSAIGARITIETDELIQTREIGGGHGHYGMQHDLVQHIGLGTACEAKITIRWPDEALSEQQFIVQSGYTYEVLQGELPTVVE